VRIILDIPGALTIRTDHAACNCGVVHDPDCDALLPVAPGQVVHITAAEREKWPRPWWWHRRKRPHC
jgi:hypothetical protein